ncbi:MAG: hypothetical protein ABFE07_24260 [Armatimonadia bacterium]
MLTLIFWAVLALLYLLLAACVLAGCSLSSRLSRAEDARHAEHAGERWAA